MHVATYHAPPTALAVDRPRRFAGVARPNVFAGVAKLTSAAPLRGLVPDAVVGVRRPAGNRVPAGTVYYSETVQQHLVQAQAVLDQHATSSADGLCVRCKAPGPCTDHERALRMFARYARLPGRRPGSTRPELIGARLINPKS